MSASVKRAKTGTAEGAPVTTAAPEVLVSTAAPEVLVPTAARGSGLFGSAFENTPHEVLEMILWLLLGSGAQLHAVCAFWYDILGPEYAVRDRWASTSVWSSTFPVDVPLSGRIRFRNSGFSDGIFLVDFKHGWVNQHGHRRELGADGVNPVRPHGMASCSPLCLGWRHMLTASVGHDAQFTQVRFRRAPCELVPGTPNFYGAISCAICPETDALAVLTTADVTLYAYSKEGYTKVWAKSTTATLFADKVAVNRHAVVIVSRHVHCVLGTVTDPIRVFSAATGVALETRQVDGYRWSIQSFQKGFVIVGRPPSLEAGISHAHRLTVRDGVVEILSRALPHHDGFFVCPRTAKVHLWTDLWTGHGDNVYPSYVYDRSPPARFISF
jgi:hypothetical protein